MPGDDTKIINTGTMRVMDLVDTKTEERENHTRTMEGMSVTLKKHITASL